MAAKKHVMLGQITTGVPRGGFSPARPWRKTAIQHKEVIQAAATALRHLVMRAGPDEKRGAS